MCNQMEPIKLFDSFAGIGALHKALTNLNIPTNLVGMSEIDIDAILAYGSIHKINIDHIPEKSKFEMVEYLQNRNIGYDFKKRKSKLNRINLSKLKLLYKYCMATNNFGDISKIEPQYLPNFDLFNFSFPCTNISVAGKQEGMVDNHGCVTSSGLYKYGVEIISTKKPKYVLIENVKNLISKKFITEFYAIVDSISELGYTCYYPTNNKNKPKCLNAKGFGIPQNRERVFVICIRKDIDDKTFEFPIEQDYGIRLKDMLEDSVDKKYYLSDEIQERFKLNGKDDIDHRQLEQIYENTNKVDRIGGIFDKEDKIHQAGSIYNKQCLSPTITTCEGGYRQPIVTDNEIQVIGKLNCKGWYEIETRVHSSEGIAPTMETRNRSKWLDEKEFKIRKLTPLECWRLMGFDDKDFYNAQALGISDSQLYKQAGNSIVVNVLYAIFKNLFNVQGEMYNV